MLTSGLFDYISQINHLPNLLLLSGLQLGLLIPCPNFILFDSYDIMAESSSSSTPSLGGQAALNVRMEAYVQRALDDAQNVRPKRTRAQYEPRQREWRVG